VLVEWFYLGIKWNSELVPNRKLFILITVEVGPVYGLKAARSRSRYRAF